MDGISVRGGWAGGERARAFDVRKALGFLTLGEGLLVVAGAYGVEPVAGLPTFSRQSQWQLWAWQQ